MKKIALTVAAATMILGSMTACGTDNQARNMSNSYQQTGFESQDMSGAYTSSRYGGQGPVTDMMTPDSRGGTYGRLDQQAGQKTRTNYNNYQVRGEKGYQSAGRDGYRANQMRPGMGRSGVTGNDRPGMVDEDGLLRGHDNTRYGTQNRQGAMDFRARRTTDLTKNRSSSYGMTERGANTMERGAQKSLGTMERGAYRGMGAAKRGAEQLTGQRTTTANYHKNYDGQTAQKLANRVDDIEGVDDCRVIVHENDVVVGVQADGDYEQVQQRVEKYVQKHVKNKDVRVVTDKDAVGRIRTMDDQLRSGAAFDEVGSTFNTMVNDLGNAVTRPFERSR
ncbi:YhcN/YlaJ family sporulation lipoprotein [Bacillus sp. FJAT-45037]|uniref:YhcN/YlaJ family sporulation lipoprotein n=1 Tax=Bacillus sp. FJAT-45037 TaxID=2011007 RepID=UPI0012FE0A9E|nr:YhcN/YlaJ family sporulation lipoprotein [Bacillus sp. FJAT-45037]